MVEFCVLRCAHCQTFQVQQVTKSKKWKCKMCNEKQSFLKEYGRGTGADCRRHVQKLNCLRGEAEYEVENSKLNSAFFNEHHSFSTNSDISKDKTPLLKQIQPESSKWSLFMTNENHDEFQDEEYSENVSDITCGEERKQMCYTTDWTTFKNAKNQGLKRKSKVLHQSSEWQTSMDHQKFFKLDKEVSLHDNLPKKGGLKNCRQNENFIFNSSACANSFSHIKSSVLNEISGFDLSKDKEMNQLDKFQESDEKMCQASKQLLPSSSITKGNYLPKMTKTSSLPIKSTSSKWSSYLASSACTDSNEDDEDSDGDGAQLYFTDPHHLDQSVGIGNKSPLPFNHIDNDLKFSLPNTSSNKCRNNFIVDTDKTTVENKKSNSYENCELNYHAQSIPSHSNNTLSSNISQDLSKTLKTRSGRRLFHLDEDDEECFDLEI